MPAAKRMITYKRDPERQKRQRAIKALGVSSWKEVERLAATPATSLLGCKTEWKNSSTGDIGDIKSGALYLIGAPSHGVVCNVYGRFRVYFKSVGNQ